MRIILLTILFSISLDLFAQEEEETIAWINQKALKIEDADPDTELVIFKDNVPLKFAEARIFGFGEASHHGKEFFDIKAKFFKYLVKNQDVKAFIMEEAYQTEAAVNEWISGGKGDIIEIIVNFTLAPWQCLEVVDLLKWIREYNLSRPNKEQIRFYGMDIQSGNDIHLEVRDFVSTHKIPVSEELLATADSCSTVGYSETPDWAGNQIPRLKEIEQIIVDFQTNSGKSSNQEFTSIIRSLNYLIKHTTYLENRKSEVRDLKMFENVKWLVDNEINNGKAFIWAHNDHVNNLTFNYYGMPWVNLGRHLKEHYKRDYYSVGFDFGVGTLPGAVIKKNKPIYWESHTLTKPFRKTYAETLIKASNDIYFVDMKEAVNSDPTNFFDTENRQLGLGGPGYNPKKKYLITKKFSEMFDGIIFVKRISVPNYNLDND
ncbi:erythromycin esterase family protein [Algoriphagus sp. AGSA1]|uniref:erythromycin esterase family protein n=1 Tax=Algoriphagus sp. AGSA1 TaxID=2907213 RepID=UPI001F1A9610|nr:erythromycin esterase family protein [Algoriphagus sp. AGSA1]MCE7056748.1 erythromycin esterase family protein [Algoriphagus sp. AGSA1]